MGSNVWLPTFDSVVKSHFATYANGCSTKDVYKRQALALMGFTPAFSLL